MNSPTSPLANGSNHGPSSPMRLKSAEASKLRMPMKQSKNDKERARQSFSCAECRRLKLKCSRVWPCTSCEKRGCAQICPKGEMRTGKGKRLILADTEELHQRISQLEVALARAHAKSSSSPHPLLASPYLYSSRNSPSQSNNVLGEDEDVVDRAFGTLTIGTEGQAKFMGSFAGSEYLREEDEGSKEGSSSGGEDGPENTTSPRNHLATPPPTAANRWTMNEDDQGRIAGLGISVTGTHPMADLRALRARLPVWEREGMMLVESYWENVNWMYQIIPRPMFDQDHLANAYENDAVPHAHKLACVFLIMAVGALFDLNRGPFNPRAEKLYDLGRECLGCVGLEHASPATVQALCLCGAYLLNYKRTNGAEVFWPILGNAVKIAQSLGLHRDGEAFGLSPYEVKERRQVWWELLTFERLQSLCFGRPCATTNKSSDTKYPEADKVYIADSDGFHAQKYRLVTMFEKAIDLQTQTTPVSISQVLDIDKEFRDFKRDLPESLLPGVAINSLPMDNSLHPHLIIHRLGIRLLIAQTRLLLNRPSFARALRSNPSDPSVGKLGESFVALYESALEIVHLVKALVIYHPSLIARWWFYWHHSVSACVCLAAIAIRAPNCAFASPAFHAMSIVVDICQAARPGCRAKNALPTLTRLRKRASEVLRTAVESHRTATNTSPSRADDDLSHLVNAAKLRRVGSTHNTPERDGRRPRSHHGSSPSWHISGSGAIHSSPSATHRSGSDPDGSHPTQSPHSNGSMFTSATLVDDSAGTSAFGIGPNTQYPYQGAVPPPPPPTAEEVQSTMQAPGWAIGHVPPMQYSASPPSNSTDSHPELAAQTTVLTRSDHSQRVTRPTSHGRPQSSSSINMAPSGPSTQTTSGYAVSANQEAGPSQPANRVPSQSFHHVSGQTITPAHMAPPTTLGRLNPQNAGPSIRNQDSFTSDLPPTSFFTVPSGPQRSNTTFTVPSSANSWGINVAPNPTAQAGSLNRNNSFPPWTSSPNPPAQSIPAASLFGVPESTFMMSTLPQTNETPPSSFVTRALSTDYLNGNPGSESYDGMSFLPQGYEARASGTDSDDVTMGMSGLERLDEEGFDFDFFVNQMAGAYAGMEEG